TLLVTSHRRGVATRTTAVDTASLSNNWVSPPSPGFPSQEFVSCGAPEREVEVVIVDVETLMECPNGKVGEIWVQSDSVAEGYWKKPEVNQEIFQAFTSSGRGPFLRTGDLGFLDAEGELHVTGRRKELIIINGQNYYPQDIERSVQTAHPGFRPGCGIAFSLVDGKGNEQLTVVQEVRKSLQDNLDGGKLFQHLTKVIMKDHGLALKRLVLLEAGKIPKTSSGKLQRAICKDRLNQDAIDYLMEIDVNSIHLRSSVAVAHETNQIRAWLIQWLSSSLSLPALEIRLSLPFYEYDWDYNRGHALSRAVY
ncbi:MAG: AMP-binding protein, partial [Verrucomicrobiae bacterium]|nr:AMP-binding protein [Verrucomicrobiae bacterium]